MHIWQVASSHLIANMLKYHRASALQPTINLGAISEWRVCYVVGPERLKPSHANLAFNQSSTAEAAPIKCDSRESAGLPTLSIKESVGLLALSI